LNCWRHLVRQLLNQGGLTNIPRFFYGLDPKVPKILTFGTFGTCGGQSIELPLFKDGA
jgi:hypothetical protein